MAVFNWDFLSAVHRLAYCNPFLPERIEAERLALGSAFIEDEKSWNVDVSGVRMMRNLTAIVARLGVELPQAKQDLLKKSPDWEAHLETYAASGMFFLYHLHLERFQSIIDQNLRASKRVPQVPFFPDFEARATELFELEPFASAPDCRAEHLFALAFQLARAFYNIYYFIVGDSQPVVSLRARVWRSIFGFDLLRYRTILFERISDISTLIIGPSGTGKELVARAVGLARYIPFNRKTLSFETEFQDLFFPINLAAFSPTLIESELFGHKKGSFTGALSDRAGWFEGCGEMGTIFLDEIGEIDKLIQIKLLRVIESRTFSRLGDNRPIRFRGKVTAATNRDLAKEVMQGNFREDLYYRLCSDVVETPALEERLADSEQELGRLLRYLAARVLPSNESEKVAADAERWIRKHLSGYHWPGNVRELDQCLRNFIMQGSYKPLSLSGKAAPDESLRIANAMRDASITCDELVKAYCRMAYNKLKSYEETGRRLGMDRRTVKARVGLPGQ